MPRSPRICPGGFVYHVLNRATEGRTIFEDAADYEEFCDLLRAGTSRVPMRICAHCLMPTHWHTVLWPQEDGAVTEYVHWVTTKHSMHYRRRSGSVGRGHVYQERFQSFPIETSQYYYNAIRYVEANALHARLVARAEEWPWSSAFERLHGAWLVVPGPLELPADWIRIVNESSDDDLKTLRECARRGRPYGSDNWVQEVARDLLLGQTLRKKGRPSAEQP